MNDTVKTGTPFDQASIEGIDIEKGLSLFGGQANIYKKILKIFCDGVGTQLDDLARLSEPGLADYAVRVHGLKGSCYGIAAMTVGDHAKELEFAAKDGDYETVLAKNKDLIDEVKELRARIADFLAGAEATASAGEKKEKPDENTLKELADAVALYDVDRVRAAVDELGKYKYEKDAELVNKLDSMAMGFEYEEIAELLKARTEGR